MKKALLIAGLCLLHSFIYGQIRGGEKSLGGNLYFHFDNGKNLLNDSMSLADQSLGFGLNPHFSFFLNKDWAIGGFLSYHHRENVNQSLIGFNQIGDYKSIFNTYGAGIFTQRYFKLGGSVYFRTAFKCAYGYSHTQRINPRLGTNRTSIYRNLSTNLSPAFSYFIKPDLALTIDWSALRYAYSVQDNSDRITHDLDFNLNMRSVGFGMEWFF